MSYTLKGHICAALCEAQEFNENISSATLRIYRAPINQETFTRVAARSGEAIAQVSPEQVKEKAQRLLAEGRTDESGRFELGFDEKQKYNEEAIEIDLFLERAPGQQRQSNNPVQITLTVLQPRWRQRENDLIAAWEFCIPHSAWCAIRRFLDAWVIVGRLTVCNTEDQNGNPVPVSDCTVNAFDNDWIQDDPLGTAVTDSSGRFRIDYTSRDFTRTPLTPVFGLRLETFGSAGPDVYFQIRRNSDSALIIDEPQERGLDSDRVNRPPCWCTQLCVSMDSQSEYPFFTQVGVFKLPQDFYTSGSLTGRLNKSAVGLGGDGWGLYGDLRLVGLMPQKHPINGQPMKYRFLYGSTANPTEPVTSAALVTPIQIGTILTGFSSNPGGWLEPQFDTVGVTPTSGGTDFDINLVPDADGWVEIPQHPNFTPNGDLIKFRTRTHAAVGGNPGNAEAGNATPPANVKNGQLLYVRLQGTDVTEAGATYQSAAYPLLINNWREIGVVNLGELETDPCSEVSENTIDVRYTTDHQFMREWSLSIASAASPWTPPALPSMSNPNPPPATTPAPITSPRGAYGTYSVDTGSWPSCTYRTILTTWLALTDGDHNEPATNIDNVMFYIKK